MGEKNATTTNAMIVPVAPRHLKTLGEIRDTFRKTEETIKKWCEEGAPIVFDGSGYSAEYNQLQAWRVKRYGKGY